MSRGNERRPIVRDDIDRRHRLEWLERTVVGYGWRLHAFVLMSNHDHLFVETPEANLSAGMQFLNGSYTSYFNWRHRRAGHLFQGRFKAQLVEEEGHYTEVSRYIHLNPVRAGVVDRPERWSWSSYPGYHRANRMLGWATYDRVMNEFGGNAAQARVAYRAFVREGVDRPIPSPFDDAIGQLIVGSEAFVIRIRDALVHRSPDPALPQLQQLRRRPALDRIVSVVSQVCGVDRDDWRGGRRSDDGARAVAAHVARRVWGYPSVEVAAVLGYAGTSGVAQAIRRIERGGKRIAAKVRRSSRKLAND